MKKGRKQNFESCTTKRKKEKGKEAVFHESVPPCTAESSTYYRLSIMRGSIDIHSRGGKREREGKSELTDG